MKKIVFGLCLYAAAMATQALELASESSMLNVVSVKNNRVAELFSFDAVTGHYGGVFTGDSFGGVHCLGHQFVRGVLDAASPRGCIACELR